MCVTAVHLQIRFIEGGDRAVTNFESGKAGLEARGFRGLGVFSSMPFEVSDGEFRTNHKLEVTGYNFNTLHHSLHSHIRVSFVLNSQTRTRSRCSSARRRLVSSTACAPRSSLT